jgi:endonuclease YncB( thermonuclease family)
MPFILIKGVFNPKSGIPDGDSVRFLASDDTLFDKLEGRVEIKSGGEVQLRYEAIDALEKAAKKPFSSDATERNIELLGGNSNGLPGFILSKQSDKNGRPVCFAFKGDTPQKDGTEVFIVEDTVKQSVNYKLLEEGMVYPMFYETLFKELRDVMTEATIAARKAKKGLWASDVSTQGFTVKPPVNLKNLPPIFPKLWRRLESFYNRRSNKDKPVEDFVADLSRRSDLLFTIPDQRSIKFSTALEVSGDQLKLLYKPEEMIFRP